jgi:hypothetical protein
MTYANLVKPSKQFCLFCSLLYNCSCTACSGSFAKLDSRPPYPATIQVMNQWFKDARICNVSQEALTALISCCSRQDPPPKQMIPMLLAMLQYCHVNNHRSSRWYFTLQKSIEYHYKTEGNCFFFGDAKSILMQADLRSGLS